MATKSDLAVGNKSTLVPQQNDLPKWILVAAIWVAGIVGSFFIYTYVIEHSTWFQWALWVAVIGLSALAALTTSQGTQLWQFFKDAKVELRKVIWPNRQETLQATLMVLVAVAIMSLLLWLIDTLLFHLISYITT